MIPLYEKLEWDSDFFGFNVGKIKGNLTNKFDCKNIENIIAKYNSRLTYFSSAEKLPDCFQNSDKLDVFLADRKTTFVKKINQLLPSDPFISKVNDEYSLENLIRLAIQSGEYSRFNVDKRISHKKFEEMYSLWMINSVKKKIAKEVLVYSSGNGLVGFVTIGERKSRSDIGIIAVDKNFRGKGIGKRLMTSAEKWSSDMGFNTIQVLTQGANLSAIKLYKSCGYSVEKVEFYYHIWRK